MIEIEFNFQHNPMTYNVLCFQLTESIFNVSLEDLEETVRDFKRKADLIQGIKHENETNDARRTDSH